MQLQSLVSLSLVAAATAATVQPINQTDAAALKPVNQTDHLMPGGPRGPGGPGNGPDHAPPRPPKPPVHNPPPPPPSHGPPPPPSKPPKHRLPGSVESIQNMKDHIKYIIAICFENRSHNNLLGGQTMPGLTNAIQQGPFCNPVNVTDPNNKDVICTGPRDFDSIPNDPNHGVPGNNLEFYGAYDLDNVAIQSGTLTPSMNGFVTEQINAYGGKDPNATFIQRLGKEVMHYYEEDEVPTITSIVQNYKTFDRWFGGMPGPTNPNRCYITSGTSNGHGANDFPAGSMPQMSIFEKLDQLDIGWRAYTEDDSTGDVLYYEYVNQPDVIDNVRGMDELFGDLAAGRLQPFTYGVPSCCGKGTNSMHPAGEVHLGERLMADIVDAVHASQYWNETLIFITFDETGGFYDNMPPPLCTRPDDLTYTVKTPTGQNYTLEFDRCGGRVPTFLISPWVNNSVEGEGMGPDGEPAVYSATSLLHTLGYLWGFEPFNDRVNSSATFDHLILDEMRTDTPATLAEGIVFDDFSR